MYSGKHSLLSSLIRELIHVPHLPNHSSVRVSHHQLVLVAENDDRSSGE